MKANNNNSPSMLSRTQQWPSELADSRISVLNLLEIPYNYFYVCTAPDSPKAILTDSSTL